LKSGVFFLDLHAPDDFKFLARSFQNILSNGKDMVAIDFKNVALIQRMIFDFREFGSGEFARDTLRDLHGLTPVREELHCPLKP
jgi:hypothetical protein